jgi:hypothetical protein
MFETKDLTKWPVEVLEQLATAIDKRIEEINVNVAHRDEIIADAYRGGDYSINFIDHMETVIERDKKDLDSLTQAKCAVVGALRVKINK